jgi:hypothetical protein
MGIVGDCRGWAAGMVRRACPGAAKPDLDSGYRRDVQLRIVKIRELMQEFDLEIDDIRWYLAAIQADRLLSYRENKRELIRLIWSGSLEGELYDMEERFLAELQNRLDRGSRDEVQVRSLLREIVASREKRYTQK